MVIFLEHMEVFEGLLSVLIACKSCKTHIWVIFNQVPFPHKPSWISSHSRPASPMVFGYSHQWRSSQILIYETGDCPSYKTEVLHQSRKIHPNYQFYLQAVFDLLHTSLSRILLRDKVKYLEKIYIMNFLFLDSSIRVISSSGV